MVSISSSGGISIAENAVINALLYGVDYGLRRAKIHICYPERNNVFAFVFIPLGAAGAAPFDNRNEIYHIMLPSDLL